jgi:hypothetical protein
LVRNDEFYEVIVETLEEAVEEWRDEPLAPKQAVFQYLVFDLMLEIYHETPELLGDILHNDSDVGHGEDEEDFDEDELFSLLFITAVAAEDFRQTALEKLPEFTPDKPDGPQGLVIVDDSVPKEVDTLLTAMEGAAFEAKTLEEIPPAVRFQLLALQSFTGLLLATDNREFYFEDTEESAELVFAIGEAVAQKRDDITAAMAQG